MTPDRIRADRRVGLLLGAVVLLAFVAFGASVALPAGDGSLAVEPREPSAAQERGMTVYRAEGCWYCHTRNVRHTRVDSELGAPLGPQGYAGMSPVMLGTERIGPDLTHLGGTYPSADALVAYLADPAAEAHRTSMPSYGYLSRADLEALAAFLLATP